MIIARLPSRGLGGRGPIGLCALGITSMALAREGREPGGIGR